MRSILKIITLSLSVLLLTGIFETEVRAQIPGSEVSGKWDLTVQTPDGERPSWLEIKTSGIAALTGRYVGAEGSARPISKINYSEDTGTYRFSIPPQWVRSDSNLEVEFSLENDKLVGELTTPNSKTLEWTGVRAPKLKPDKQIEWGEPINLLDENLSKWNIPENNQYSMDNGVLKNEGKGGNLITKETFSDFKLHVEFRYPEGSNSGIYLRGRYEVQITDNYGMDPGSQSIGSVYGFIKPSENAAKKAGEWQTYDITLNGRMVDVVLNGTRVICNRPIPGTTGGALDSNEGEPGPIMLQGDHGVVEFRKITITPAK